MFRKLGHFTLFYLIAWLLLNGSAVLCGNTEQRAQELQYAPRLGWAMPAWSEEEEVEVGSMIQECAKVLFGKKDDFRYRLSESDYEEARAEQEKVAKEIEHLAKERALADSLSQIPASYVIDPRGELTDRDLRELNGLLNRHAGLSKHNLYLYIYESKTDWPQQQTVHDSYELHASSQTEEIVAAYYLATPSSSEIVAPEALPSQQWLKSALSASENKERPLEVFINELSLQIVDEQPYLLDEVEDVVGSEDLVLNDLIEKTEGSERFYLWSLVGAVIFMISSIVMIFRSKKHKVYQFTPHDIQPSLGAPHGLGPVLTMDYSNADRPISEQKKERLKKKSVL